MGAGRSMRGSWAGVYAYDPSPTIPADLPSFGFTLDIDEECEGKFRGAVRDEYLAGVAEPGRVQGRVVGDDLEFIKRVPVLYVIEAGQVRSLEECVREWWGLEMDTTVPSPHIHYEGSFSADGQEIAGRWWIGKTTIAVPSGGQRYALDLSTAAGCWSARQCSSGR